MANLILEKEIEDGKKPTHVRYLYAVRSLEILIDELNNVIDTFGSSGSNGTHICVRRSNYDNLLSAINSIEKLCDHLGVFTQEISAKQELIRQVECFVNSLERDHENQLKSL